ncbi:hypothetical protein MCOR27_002166 [Pyricularia oryzae]|uniref:Uncharacterized protein n=2 Tax=Pyricularia TaxID=48558 RepID=A0ABQ8NKK2_PYRGI|nr:hypothetical protein MCOR01_003515 [Pyricularia oryzae]KAI6298388.1 hypothetical protein MCOR33_005461 [Pyricularia grisea]KAI6256331.1 hypothetical protein MCOR19_007215 [Pyricularia oryzae]KAI6285646.1 hypothetical protein MCOR27_002166 [Pyricularia oryzae]KAI6313424.1 hypothetical protein MCOR29_007738 [Pyricularia oryzae]
MQQAFTQVSQRSSDRSRLVPRATVNSTSFSVMSCMDLEAYIQKLAASARKDWEQDEDESRKKAKELAHMKAGLDVS